MIALGVVLIFFALAFIVVDAIAAGGNADDFFGFAHRKDAMAGFTA